MPSLCLWALGSALLLLARAAELAVMESTVLSTTSTVDAIYSSIQEALVLVALQTEQVAQVGRLPVVPLSELSYVPGAYPIIQDRRPNRTTEFTVSCDALATDPDPLLVEPFEQFGNPRCWCRAEWELFCNASAEALAGSPCISCERACDILFALRLSAAMDPVLRPLVPTHPFCMAWIIARGNGERHLSWESGWALHPRSVETGLFSYEALGPNRTAWTSKEKGGFATSIVDDRKNMTFDRTPVWSAPFWLAPRKTVAITVGVPMWSKNGEYLGGFFTDIPMSSSKSFFLNLSFVSPPSDEAIYELWGTCAKNFCNMSSLDTNMDYIASQTSHTGAEYWVIKTNGERYIVMHQTLTLGWKLWFFIRYSDAFPSMAVAVPVVVLTAAFIICVVVVQRIMRRRVLELEKQLGTMATSSVIGTPAEDAIRSLIKVQKKGKLTRDLREEISTVMTLIASNKLFKATSNLREKLEGMNLEKDVDAFLLSVLTEKDRPDTLLSQKSMNSSGMSLQSQNLIAVVDSVPGSVGSPEADEIEDALSYVAAMASPTGAMVTFGMWNYDIERANVPAGATLLEVATMAALDSQDLVSAFGLDRRRVRMFLRGVEHGYKNNPYHTSVHAADVVQAMHSLMSACTAVAFTPLEKLAALLAAACHDYGHWGVNNTFLQATMDPLYVQYNGISVLESMHSAESMRLMLSKDFNFLQGKLSRDDTFELHKTVTQLILATDMSRHLELTSLFTTRTTAGKLDPASKADRLLVLQMLIKASDVSNPAREWAACQRWARRVMEEFLEQGDRERAEGLKISPFMDRSTSDVAKCQVAFIKFVVRPMMELVQSLSPSVGQCMLANLAINAHNWEA
eukprot:m51a1_g8672 putative protein pde- isoform a (855) ;mRNA; r:129094-132214